MKVDSYPGAARRSVVALSRTFALFTDWASYLDQPNYQDPEVAYANGYDDVPIPPGALSVIGTLTESECSAWLSRSTTRTWRGQRLLVAGTRLVAEIRPDPDGACLTTQFLDERGNEVASERFSTEIPTASCGPELTADLRVPFIFETGPIDSTRVVALSFALASLYSAEPSGWAMQPPSMVNLARKFVLPSLVASRAHTTGPDAARNLISIDVVANRGRDALAQAGSEVWIANRDGAASNICTVDVSTKSGQNIATTYIVERPQDA
jgi:hypothetical protein